MAMKEMDHVKEVRKKHVSEAEKVISHLKVGIIHQLCGITLNRKIGQSIV